MNVISEPCMNSYTFADIAGQDTIKKSLIKAISAPAHAYIIQGQQGSGKTLLAKTFAKGLLCTGHHVNGSRPCCNCISCQTFDSNNNPDVLYVTPVKAKTIGVADVREQIIRHVEIKPYQYEYKIFIIEDADALTREAQNAILKTIEEPPVYGIFLFLAQNSYSLLPTILSRCVTYKLRALDAATVSSCLQHMYDIPAEKAGVAAGFSAGNIGKALQLAASDDFMQLRGQMIGWLRSLRNMDVVEVMALAKEMEGYKDRLDSMFEIAIMWYRDLLVIKTEDTLEYILQADLRDELNETAVHSSYGEIYKNIETITKTKHGISRNANLSLSLEIMMLKLKENTA